jgi:hypothetical protein
VLPALVANQLAIVSLPYHPGELAVDSYRHAVPLEDLGVPDSKPLLDLNLRSVTPELRSFLLTEQAGARAVAKRLFRLVSDYRLGSFSAATAQALPSDALDAVFAELPGDRGHFGVSYFNHILRGLRRRPPTYLAEMLRRSPLSDPPAELDGVSGVVIVQV